MQNHFLKKLPCEMTICDFDDKDGRLKKLHFVFAAVEEVCEKPFQLFPHRGAGQAANEIHTVRR